MLNPININELSRLPNRLLSCPLPPADRVYDVGMKDKDNPTMTEILEHPATWQKFDEFVDEINAAIDDFERRHKVTEQVKAQAAIRQSFEGK